MNKSKKGIIEPPSGVSADQAGGKGNRMLPEANAAARKEQTRSLRLQGAVQVRSSPIKGNAKKHSLFFE